MANSPVVGLRVEERLARELDSRAPYLGGRAETIRTDLGRYRALVRSARARLARECVFSLAEQALILDALNGSLLRDRPEALVGSVADAMSLDGLAQKWEIEAHALREKLASLTPLEFAAVADAAEAFWSAPEEKDVRGGLFGGGA